MDFIKPVNGLGQIVMPPPVQSSPPPTIQPANSSPAADNLAPNKKVGVLDSILFALLGTPEQLLSDSEVKQAEGKRAEAGALSKTAAENPGEAHMGIPSGGSTSFTDMLSMLMRVI